MLRTEGKRHTRYLGHDTSANAAVRGVQKDRLKKMHARKPRLSAQQKGAGRGRAARLWTTGATPAVGHGAAVSGINDGELKQLRSMAGSLCGFSGAGPLTLYLAVQKQRNFDPIFHATCSVLMQHAPWVWAAT
eukprot:7667196-Pyramimonas_sp.AAC.1